MLKKQIVFSDYDGTIYIKEQDMPQNIKLIEQYRELGGKFVIVTGRSKTSFNSVIEKYKIPYDYVIANNGAIIFDSCGNKICDYTISSEISLKVIKYLNSKQNIEIFFYDESDKVKYTNQELLKIRAKILSKEVAEQIEKEINFLFGDNVIAHAAFPFMYYNHLNYSLVDIVSINAGKEKSIEKLLYILNIPKENAVTIGDGRNDINMIRKYNGYSMETAEKEVKEAASEIFKSVGEMLENIII